MITIEPHDVLAFFLWFLFIIERILDIISKRKYRFVDMEQYYKCVIARVVINVFAVFIAIALLMVDFCFQSALFFITAVTYLLCSLVTLNNF